MPEIAEITVTGRRAVKLQVDVNDEIRWQLSSNAAKCGLSQSDYLHRALCHALDRDDLLEFAPSILTDDEPEHRQAG